MKTLSPINNILIAYDGSKPSRNALNYAIALTKILHGKLTILKSYNVPVETTTTDAATGVYPISLTDFKEATEDELNQLSSEFTELHEIDYFTTTSPGMLAQALNIYSEEYPVDLIIMGTHGASGWEQFLGGSTTANMVGSIDSPLWVIPENALYRNPQNIAIAIDPDHIPEKEKLRFMELMDNAFDINISVIYVAEKDVSGIHQLKTSIGKEATFVRLDGDVDNAINEYTSHNNIDTLFVIHKDRNFISDLFHKSMSKKIVSTTKIPVVVL
ncbi:universal stress protein [Fulvivirga ligni]|uniref:universal stress protein n=1 Tax=Fulvivirga ligni TaxID=2904246 RepID=UPI001F3AF53D|nr:universal stress protein [Fulvivirga ligni]UII23285.1 universal stress protein [Fulvivirga ligni]